MWAPSPLWAPLCQGGPCHSTRGRSRLPVPVHTPRQIAFILRVTRCVQGTCPLPVAGADRQSRRKHQTEPWPSFPRLVFPWSQQGAACSGEFVKSYSGGKYWRIVRKPRSCSYAWRHVLYSSRNSSWINRSRKAIVFAEVFVCKGITILMTGASCSFCCPQYKLLSWH